MYRFVRLTSLLAIVGTAALGMANMFKQSLPGITVGDQIRYALSAAAFWGVLLWLIWTRPRFWSLGIGCFLLLILAFQTYLWTLAMARPDRNQLGFSSTPLGFFIYEVPLIVAIVSCFTLRWLVPKLPQDTPKAS